MKKLLLLLSLTLVLSGCATKLVQDVASEVFPGYHPAGTDNLSSWSGILKQDDFARKALDAGITVASQQCLSAGGKPVRWPVAETEFAYTAAVSATSQVNYSSIPVTAEAPAARRAAAAVSNPRWVQSGIYCNSGTGSTSRSIYFEVWRKTDGSFWVRVGSVGDWRENKRTQLAPDAATFLARASSFVGRRNVLD